MKTIKYLIMGVLLAGFSTTANAQQEELNAALNAIKTNAADKADLAKTAYKKNKKDPEALMKIALRLPVSTTRPSTSTPRTPRVTRSGLWYIVRSARSRLLRSCRT